jgi:hypothetical protein
MIELILRSRSEFWFRHKKLFGQVFAQIEINQGAALSAWLRRLWINESDVVDERTAISNIACKMLEEPLTFRAFISALNRAPLLQSTVMDAG